MWYCFLFFKQKTAYEMRISDWSSDVCSSDLESEGQGPGRARRQDLTACSSRKPRKRPREPSPRGLFSCRLPDEAYLPPEATRSMSVKIGRASCRERVCQYV